MCHSMERRPGIAYRRPDGDPERFVAEAVGESQLNAAALPRTEWSATVADADRDRFRAAFDDERVDITYRLALGDAKTWVHERGFRDDRGDLVGYLFTAGDRVERRRQLERQRERLEEFASVVSHDLRNPLSVAVGNVELATELEGEAGTERLDRALDALDWMNDLISDLLALAREGRSVEETTREDLTAIVESAWRTVGAPANATLAVDEPLPRIECDRCRLRQALENLFRNAIEHGVDGGAADGFADVGDGSVTAADSEPGAFDEPAIRVFVGRLDGGFYVADDGEGIAPQDRDSVFEPGHTSADGGTGFGLAIVDRIAEAHDWEVSITEGRAGGARFEFDGVDIAEATRSHGSRDAAEGGSDP